MESNWDKVYSKAFGGTWYPNEGVIRFTARFLQRRVGINTWDVKRKARRILDNGCGNGRHIVFFAKQGFEVYGIDTSEEAIEIAEAWLSREKLKAHLGVGNVTKLPFEDQFFDVVISCEVLDHMKFSEAKDAMREIARVSIDKAYVYLTLRATSDSEYGRGQEVDKNIFTLQEGYEKGIIQHFFSQEEIEELFRGFNIFDIELYEQKFPRVFSIDKAFLQSSKGEKNLIDLSKPLDFSLKYSRWHIAAEKV